MGREIIRVDRKFVEFAVPQQLLRNNQDSSALYDVHLIVSGGDGEDNDREDDINLRSENRRALTLIFYEASETDMEQRSEASRSAAEAIPD